NSQVSCCIFHYMQSNGWYHSCDWSMIGEFVPVWAATRDSVRPVGSFPESVEAYWESRLGQERSRKGAKYERQISFRLGWWADDVVLAAGIDNDLGGSIYSGSGATERSAPRSRIWRARYAGFDRSVRRVFH